jgi:diguanylate cyclase (GGDEF)-like protein
VGSTAIKDPLTGLLSKAGLEPVLEREWKLARRRTVSSILLVANVDGFNRINEEGGPGRGDRALRIVARVLTECCRAGDVVARVGDDDFVVILAGAKVDQPTSYVERVTERLAGDERAPTLSYGWTRLINASDPAHAIDLAEALRYKRRAVSGTRAV